jgi:predicted nuclease of predicted toxin-antitoxin system
MKLLLDQGLPRSAAEFLRRRGFEAVHTAEVGLSSAQDNEILARGRGEQQIIVTLDADFHALMALSGAERPSVIRIRREGLTAEPLIRLILDVISICRGDIEAGALVTVRPDAIKIRRLPVLGEGGE